MQRKNIIILSLVISIILLSVGLFWLFQSKTPFDLFVVKPVERFVFSDATTCMILRSTNTETQHPWFTKPSFKVRGLKTSVPELLWDNNEPADSVSGIVSPVPNIWIPVKKIYEDDNVVFFGDVSLASNVFGIDKRNGLFSKSTITFSREITSTLGRSNDESQQIVIAQKGRCQ